MGTRYGHRTNRAQVDGTHIVAPIQIAAPSSQSLIRFECRDSAQNHWRCRWEPRAAESLRIASEGSTRCTEPSPPKTMATSGKSKGSSVLPRNTLTLASQKGSTTFAFTYECAMAAARTGRLYSGSGIAADKYSAKPACGRSAGRACPELRPASRIWDTKVISLFCRSRQRAELLLQVLVFSASFAFLAVRLFWRIFSANFWRSRSSLCCDILPILRALRRGWKSRSGGLRLQNLLLNILGCLLQARHSTEVAPVIAAGLKSENLFSFAGKSQIHRDNGKACSSADPGFARPSSFPGIICLRINDLFIKENKRGETT